MSKIDKNVEDRRCPIGYASMVELENYKWEIQNAEPCEVHPAGIQRPVVEKSALHIYIS